MKSLRRLLLTVALCASSSTAWSSPMPTVQLTFEGLGVRSCDPGTGICEKSVLVPTKDALDKVLVHGYYAGDTTLRTSGALFGQPASGAGPDFGIRLRGTETFDATTGALASAGSVFALEQQLNGGSGAFGSDPSLGLGTGALGLLERGTAHLQFDSPPAFDDGLSFFYSGLGSTPLELQVMAGQTLRARFVFSGVARCADPLAPNCQWQRSGIGVVTSDQPSAAQDLAQLDFSGVTELVFIGQGVFIDNLTFGSANPDTIPTIPEPASYALMAFGLAAAAMTARRRSRRA